MSWRALDCYSGAQTDTMEISMTINAVFMQLFHDMVIIWRAYADVVGTEAGRKDWRYVASNAGRD